MVISNKKLSKFYRELLTMKTLLGNFSMAISLSLYLFSYWRGYIIPIAQNILICGNFHLPKINWESPELTTVVDEVRFTEMLKGYQLS